MLITSKQNEKIKYVISLKQKKYRDLYNVYIVEGFKMLNDAIKNNMQITEVFAVENTKLPNFEGDVIVNYVSESIFKLISDEVTPQGVLALIKKPQVGSVTDIKRCVLLDRVQDPGNMGTIIRLCTAVDIKYLICVECVDTYSPKVVRSSMSGIYNVEIINCNQEKAFEIIKSNQMQLLATKMQGENIFNFVPNEKFCLCMGNEGNGISEYFLQNADKYLSIPMSNKIESLNVGVATGISIYTLLNNYKGVN